MKTKQLAIILVGGSLGLLLYALIVGAWFNSIIALMLILINLMVYRSAS